ncbi:Protein kinase domain and Serine/threonine-/dual specificity protein kinase, catalytic domain and Protein kinase-like domain-containing protein [Strongyloides ratti]|uniref:non-specific serine/threonine protein kinase n=1 Tax=Strongyloides ratti TaxID=34506 RepID=A0A090LAM6_STRRB|nr:Protein kinase domain and Serine/threonine-/dual specificity protein kinase, catalytic domain and Protein kinase-like domain-containing protein [Strongyloides ratti]CEF66841.1 Protein kinase domain and Serine/threonine-/dual specificity protein kinase, catalytic domain and Protein kinase-like domain-containing protein [Strongyloides ratti]
MNTLSLFKNNFENKTCDNTNNQKQKVHKNDYPYFNELLGRKIKGWECEEIIGKGTFGVIYKCFKEQTEEISKKIEKITGALKAEDQTKKVTHIVKEIRILESLKKIQNGKNYFAEVLDYGEKRKFKFIITTLFGSNLFDILIQMPNQRIEIRTWIRVVINIFEGLKHLHSIKVIHMDLKPANIIVDYQNKRKNHEIVVRIIDFGLAKHLKYKNIAEEIPKNFVINNVTNDKNDPYWIGSIFHCSPYIHKGYDSSYRDDIYSWLYVSMDLFKELPWSPNDTELSIIKQKFNSTINTYKNYFPIELESIIKSIVESPPNKPPDYDGILKDLKNFMQILTISWNEPCQWETIFGQKQTLQKQINLSLKQSDFPDLMKKKISDNDIVGQNINEKEKNNNQNLKTNGFTNGKKKVKFINK